MRITKLFAAAALLLTTALVGGTLISGVLAAPQANDPSDVAPPAVPGLAEYCDVFLDSFAAELGVERTALVPAARAAANAAIDAAIADGTLPAERGAALRERLNALNGEPCALAGGWSRGGLGHPGVGRGWGHVERDGGDRDRGGGGLGGLLNPAAELLGMNPGELRRELRASSLADVAAERGVAYDSVTAAILDALRERLETAVTDGMPQERADAALDRLESWLAEGGQPGAGHGHGLGRGHGRGGPSGESGGGD